MLKRVNNILNIIIGTCVGVFIGHAIYVYWDYQTNPEVYVVWSAPWYTSILVYGIFTTAVLLITVGIKFVIRRKINTEKRCGGCRNNCLVSELKCERGIEKAKLLKEIE